MEKKENFLKRHWLVMLCGLLVGAAAVVLAAFGLNSLPMRAISMAPTTMPTISGRKYWTTAA